MGRNIEIKENYFYVSSFKNGIHQGKKIKLSGHSELKPGALAPNPSKSSTCFYPTATDEEVHDFKDLKSAQEFNEKIPEKHFKVFIAKRDLSGVFLEES
jgi:hypothetical protein